MGLKYLVILAIGFISFSCSNNTDKILYIADAKVPCVGTSQECLQIKEEGTTEWISFYNKIEGFDYKEGFFYKIKVDILDTENSPADGSTMSYKLIEILDKSRVPLNLDQGSWLVTRIKDRDSFGRNPFIKIDLSQNEINGNTSCNRFSGKIRVTNTKVEISKLSSTEMACRDTEVESAFLEALKRISYYSLKEDKLQLLDENQELLIECDYLKHE